MDIPVYQISCNAGANEETHVDVNGVAAVLRDLGQSTDAGRNGKRKHQDGLEKFGAVRDDGVEVHLQIVKPGVLLLKMDSCSVSGTKQPHYIVCISGLGGGGGGRAGQRRDGRGGGRAGRWGERERRGGEEGSENVRWRANYEEGAKSE